VSTCVGVAADWAAAASLTLAGPRQTDSKQVQSQPTQFRVLKAVCGAKGVTRGALFEMQDARNVFHVPEDHEIIVYFEWEGPPGSHHAEGSWRSPDGKVALTSDFDLVSEGTQYAGTWRLALPETITPGLWALEAQIDGKPAGTQAFEIISNAPPPLPTAGEIYQRSAAASVFVTSLDGDGETISRGFGFFIDKGVVLTAFQVIDGASSLRIDFADGSNAKISDVVAWNRRQDWAILKMDSGTIAPLERAPANSWKVGDLEYVLISQGPGSRTIQNVNITGLQGTLPAEQRLSISALGAGVSLGSPLLDDHGRVVGILGGGLGGFGSRRMGTWAPYVDLGDSAAALAEPTVWPLSKIPESAPSQIPVTFAYLQAKGVLMSPIVRNSQVATATMGEDFQKEMGIEITVARPKHDFPRKLGKFALVVTWGPSENVKSTEQLRIFDADNRAVLQTTPAKINLRTHETAYSAWRVPFSSLGAGVYRVDVLLGDQTQWREFIRISE